MEKETPRDHKFITTLIYTIIICFQPIIWYLIYCSLESKETGFGLGFVCVLSCILCGLGSAYIGEYIIRGENPLD